VTVIVELSLQLQIAAIVECAKGKLVHLAVGGVLTLYQATTTLFWASVLLSTNQFCDDIFTILAEQTSA